MQYADVPPVASWGSHIMAGCLEQDLAQEGNHHFPPSWRSSYSLLVPSAPGKQADLIPGPNAQRARAELLQVTPTALQHAASPPSSPLGATVVQPESWNRRTALVPTA